MGENSFRNNNGPTITVNNCSFTGNINSNNCGGIAGQNSFRDNSDAIIIVQNCRFTGDINGGRSGGIVSDNSFWDNSDATITVQNCHFMGNIDNNNGGGIVGPNNFRTNSDAIITINNCRFAGDIDGNNGGGIVGPNSFQDNHGSAITVQSCRFTGDINGSRCGGIVGENSFWNNTGATVTVNNCGFTGGINGNENASIVGPNSFRNNTQIIIQNCYLFCNIIVNAQKCGGILGESCGNSQTPPITVKECYSTGTILNPTSYAILGPNTQNCTVLDCIYNSFYNTMAGPDYPNGGPLNNTYQNTIGLSNITGRNTAQLIYTPYECPLHPKLLNTCPYQKQNKNLTIVAAFSICKPIAICSILTFILKNVCSHVHLYIYSKDMKFKSPLYWNNNNAQYNGTLASGTYIIAAKK